MLNDDVRQIVSFGGRCPFNCNHCYTFSRKYVADGLDDINSIVASIKSENIKIVYVSGHRENFIDPDEGLLLCESIMKKIKVDLLITTRNVFNDMQLSRLQQLSKEMEKKGCDLFVCSSIPANASYRKLEPSPLIPSPAERMNFLEQVFKMGIHTILTIRPLCPDEYIPINEPLEIVDKCHSFSSVILSSGIVVDEDVLERLKTFPKFKSQGKEPLYDCLKKKDLLVDYVDVDKEWITVKERCEYYGKQLFSHSLVAVDSLRDSRACGGDCHHVR